jgi:cytochrome c554/c'-like protein
MLTLWLLLSLADATQAPSAASDNECAVCHLRLVWTRSEITHVDEWVTSKHALYRVGCDRCHGGDRKTANPSIAHQGVLNSADADSRVHREALPATCGRCHASEARAFASTAHQALLSRHDRMAPTCTSCHSSMASAVPSPAALEQQCLRCHSRDLQDRSHVARHQVEDIAALRAVLKRTRFEIAAVMNIDRQAALTVQWIDADRLVRSVVAGLHAFDQRRVDTGLSDAHTQIDRLVAQLGE